MKITLNIEIPDEALRNAVESQVGITLAKMTAEAITKKADEIINTKFDRYDPGTVLMAAANQRFTKAIDDAITSTLGQAGYARRDRITGLVKEAAVETLRANLK